MAIRSPHKPVVHNPSPEWLPVLLLLIKYSASWGSRGPCGGDEGQRVLVEAEAFSRCQGGAGRHRTARGRVSGLRPSEAAATLEANGLAARTARWALSEMLLAGTDRQLATDWQSTTIASRDRPLASKSTTIHLSHR